MSQVKVLGIAPYEGMLHQMRQAAAKRDDIALTAFVGDMQTGAAIASRYTPDDFDVILSRGGTAEMIRRQSSLPVVEITLSAYDILRSIKLAETGSGKYAIIGFPAITRNARFLCDMLQYNVDIFTINDEEEAHTAMRRLTHDGYAMVLCDMIASSIAQRYGIPAMLINSGQESVELAMEQAVQSSRTYRQLKERMGFFRAIAEAQPLRLLVLDEHGEACYDSHADPLPKPVLAKINSTIEPILAEGGKRFFCEVSGKHFSITGSRVRMNEQTYIVYSLSAGKAVLTLEKYGIHLIDKEEATDRFFNSFYGITRSSFAEGVDIDRYAKRRDAVVILGEFGTGKDQMVRLLYARSDMSHAPLVIIDCAQLRSRGWNYLVENKYSPLTETDITIHFKNISALTDEQFLELFMMIKDMHVHQRNRLIFGAATDANRSSEERIRKIVDWFSCLVITMPSMRENREAIPQLASLYISTLNMQYAKEIIGLEPEGLRLMENYSWPNNYDQFKRILNELVLGTDTPFIRTEAIHNLLKREIRMFGEITEQTIPFNQTLTLDEINLQILKQVLAQEHGNQSTAAKRLGISRTTLWRMLQKCMDTATTNTHTM
ncbi:MAG: PrpR N-terminal domain-containing protein [Eubacteriales bacterium]|nr:PrpR N-terminal domain-containing protein [Eubacteriales bacterium]